MLLARHERGRGKPGRYWHGWESRSPGTSNGGPSCGGFLGHDLRNGVCHGEADGVSGHAGDVVLGEKVAPTDADEYLSANESVFERTAFLVWICALRQFFFERPASLFA